MLVDMIPLRSPNFRSEVDEENIRKYGTKYPEFLP